MGEDFGTICGVFINMVSNWYRIGAKLAPHDPQIVKLSPNLPKRLPSCSRDGFEASYREVYSNTLVRIYPSWGKISARFVECSLTWYHIGTELAPHWHHMIPALLVCYQICQHGFQVVTAMVSRPVIVRFIQTPS